MCAEKCRLKWKNVNLRLKAPCAILMLSQDMTALANWHYCKDALFCGEQKEC